jgi:hypothetical protein
LVTFGYAEVHRGHAEVHGEKRRELVEM